MTLAVTINGSLGRSTSSYQREILRNIAFASAECTEAKGVATYLLRKDAEGGIPDTTFPIQVSFDNIVTAKFVYIHVTNNATIRIKNTAGAANNQSVELVLGGPEGAVILNASSITGIEITATSTDESVVEIFIAGIR